MMFWTTKPPGYHRLSTCEGNGSIQLDKEGSSSGLSLLPRRLLRLSAQGAVILLTVVVLVPMLVAFGSMQGRKYLAAKYATPFIELVYPDAEVAESGDRRFVIVIPADSPSPDLGKLVISATALGYPAPVIVNWAKDFHKTGDGYGSSHLGKITGTLEYLDAATQKDANSGDMLDDRDLVLVLDAYDVWFQLPPEVLLQRYHRTVAMANVRLAEQWDVDDDMPMQQTIVISTQKRCFPTIDSGMDLHCDILPESTLQSDLYFGTAIVDSSNSYHDVLPKFVNSGSIMGPVGDMKRMFRRAKERTDRKLAQGIELTSDQAVFGEIFGEQEVWRAWRRERHEMPGGDIPHNEATGLLQSDFELHIGLDYTQDLFLPTVYEERDGAFVAFNNQSTIAEHSRRLGIQPARLRKVPRDIEAARNPLADLIPDPAARSWGNMSLYADFFTTAVPTVLHHNAWRGGRKQRRVNWWDRTWYFPFLRELLELHLQPAELLPLADLPAHEGGRLMYWAPSSDAERRRPRLFAPDRMRDSSGLEEAEFADLFRYPDETEASEKHWYDEVFRDGKGWVH